MIQVEAMRNTKHSDSVQRNECAPLTGASAVHDLVLTLTRWIHASRREGTVPQTWGNVLGAVVVRITRLSTLDRAGQELAVCAYLIGVLVGIYGEQSVMVHGVRLGYEVAIKRYRTPQGRRVDRLFAALMSVGRRHGRSMMGAASAECTASDRDADCRPRYCVVRRRIH